MKDSKRIFYLDFVRAVAVILIVLTHYNALYIYIGDEIALQKVVLTWRVANLYIGDFGVSLFLIISGASLMYVYGDRLEIKQFYKKRFLSIYPMFWIAYLTAFMHTFYNMRGIDQSIPKWSILLSLIGMDGYLNGIVPTFYKVGEWFLGFIILFYIIFPALRWMVCKYPRFTLIIVLSLYVISNIFYQLPMKKSIFLLTRLPEIVFGMIFVKYMNERKSLACVGLIILAINTLTKPTIDTSFQTTYVGISAFLVLAYLAKYIISKRVIVKCISVICKYSYAIFLTHHYIIGDFASKFDLYNITILESYLLFILCCFWIALFSKLLYEANGYIINMCQSCVKD